MARMVMDEGKTIPPFVKKGGWNSCIFYIIIENVFQSKIIIQTK
jgi:hypothetical protein